MDSTELRNVQGPLKARYRETPEAAVVTLKAEGDLDADGIACRVETGRALVEAGPHPATGGSGLQACSGDMLLEALVACAGVTLKAVATALDRNRRRLLQQSEHSRRSGICNERHTRSARRAADLQRSL